jgi:hypothetical protein
MIMAKKKGSKGSSGYTVGRGKPPKHAQWKPGQSGNPKGRPKGSLNLSTIFQEVLFEAQMELIENGLKREVPVVVALLKRMIHDGLKGDHKATDSLLDRAERHLLSTAELPDDDLDDDDLQILSQALERRKAGASRAGGSGRKAPGKSSVDRDDEEGSDHD